MNTEVMFMFVAIVIFGMFMVHTNRNTGDSPTLKFITFVLLIVSILAGFYLLAINFIRLI